MKLSRSLRRDRDGRTLGSRNAWHHGAQGPRPREGDILWILHCRQATALLGRSEQTMHGRRAETERRLPCEVTPLVLGNRGGRYRRERSAPKSLVGTPLLARQEPAPRPRSGARGGRRGRGRAAQAGARATTTPAHGRGAPLRACRRRVVTDAGFPPLAGRAGEVEEKQRELAKDLVRHLRSAN